VAVSTVSSLNTVKFLFVILGGVALSSVCQR